MKKVSFLNKKGFALTETLIVTVIVLLIFSIIFTNFYPLLGEYEKMDNYDTIDSKYNGYWLRKNILEDGQDSLFNFDLYGINNCRNNCHEISDCSEFKDKKQCTYLFSEIGITKIYITRYNISGFKAHVKNYMNTDRQLQEYLNYLPDYTNTGCYDYRLIFEYKADKTDPNNDTRLFGTIGVKR